MKVGPRFAENCLHRCRQALAADTGTVHEEQVDGKHETYWVLHLRGASPCEIYVYSDGAGIMSDGSSWHPFEAPDYDSEEALIDAVVGEIGRLTMKKQAE